MKFSVKKILLFAICLTFFVIGAIPAKAEVYSSGIDIIINAPEGFAEEVVVTFTSMNVETLEQGDSRVTTATVVLNSEVGYVKTIDNVIGGQFLATIKFSNSKAEDNWALEQAVYDVEVKEGSNPWEFSIKKVEKVEQQDVPSKPFWQIISDLVLSSWRTSGPVIITLLIVCLWYLKYKYDHYDKF